MNEYVQVLKTAIKFGIIITGSVTFLALGISEAIKFFGRN